jgi:hypothetical protein
MALSLKKKEEELILKSRKKKFKLLREQSRILSCNTSSIFSQCEVVELLLIFNTFQTLSPGIPDFMVQSPISSVQNGKSPV